MRVGKPSELREDQNGFSGTARSHDKSVPLSRPQSAEHKRVPNLLNDAELFVVATSEGLILTNGDHTQGFLAFDNTRGRGLEAV